MSTGRASTQTSVPCHRLYNRGIDARPNGTPTINRTVLPDRKPRGNPDFKRLQYFVNENDHVESNVIGSKSVLNARRARTMTIEPTDGSENAFAM